MGRVPQDGQWFAVDHGGGRYLTLHRPLQDKAQIRVTPHGLSRALQLKGSADIVRIVVLEPTASGGDPLELGEEGLTPVGRLMELLRPESPDFWIILIFALVSGVLAMATPLAIEALVNTVSFGRLLQPIVILALMLLVVLLFSAALRLLQTFVVEIIQRRLFARVAADLTFRLCRVRFASYDQANARELVNRFFDVVSVQKVTAQLLLDGVSLVINTLVGMTVLAFYNPWLLGFDFVLLVLIAVGIFVLGRGAIATAIKESKLKYRMAAWLEDVAGSPTAFRYDGAAEFAMERSDRVTFDYLTARKKHFRILIRQIAFALIIQAVASTVLLGLGGWLVINNELSLGQLVAAELIVTIIVGSFAKLGKHMESFYDLVAAVDKLGILFDLPVEEHDGLLNGLEEQPADVVLENVTYSLPNQHDVLRDFSFRIAGGEHTLLRGPSGSGKTVLMDLLFGLRTPTRGRISIDGMDLRDLRPDVCRRYVNLVRDVEIFEGTVAENVHLERPHVSTIGVREALKHTGVLDAVLTLPNGLDSQLTTSGSPLTSNQARRLMLARAIAGRPTLLMIDGLLDTLPDDDVRALAAWLCRSDQPWTLLMVSQRSCIADLFPAALELRPGDPEPTRTSPATS